MRHRTPVLLTAFLLTTVPGSRTAPAGEQEEPLPAPFIEREEVRFITLDIIAEERAGGWRPLRDLTVRQIEVRVGHRVMPVDLFENRCRSEPAMGTSPGRDATGGSSPPKSAGPPPERRFLRFGGWPW